MESERDIKICETCGEPFGCGVKLDGCWCNEIKLPGEIADELKTKYQDCLCPDCLKKTISPEKT